MKTAYFGGDKGPYQRSGIDVIYTATRRELRISGWYDGFVGIEPETLPLADFLERIGVSDADLRVILKERKAMQQGALV